METYQSEKLFNRKNGHTLPSRDKIIDILEELRQAVFPGYFGRDNGNGIQQDYYVGYLLNRVHKQLKEQVEIALLYQEDNQEPDRKKQMEAKAGVICQSFIRAVPNIQ